MALLTDEEVEEIRHPLREGVRGRPVLVKWVEQLLADRDERVGQRARADRALTRLVHAACCLPRLLGSN